MPGRCFGVDLTAPTIPEISAQQKERIQRTAAQAADKGRVGQINPHYVCAKISRAIEPDDIVVNEAVTRLVLKMTCDASAERLDVRPHCALRSLRIVVADGGKNGFMLLLKTAVVVRRGK